MTKEEKLKKIEDYKFQIYKEEVSPVGVMSNLDFSEITETNSAGHYQYSRDNQTFLYRDILNIREVRRVDLLTFVNKLEKKVKEYLELSGIEISIADRQYRAYLIKNDGQEKYYFTLFDKNLFNLLIQLYLYSKDEAKKDGKI